MNPTIYTHTFDNGLKLVVQEMAWLPSASFNLLLPCGAVTDPGGASGSAAVLAEWLDRGAGTRDSRTLSDDLDALGVRRGGGAGGESTVLSGSLLADALPEALTIYADIVRRPYLSEAEFEPARAVVLQDLASLDDNPAQRLFIALAKSYFASAHGRSSYGEADDLKALSAEGVRQDAARRLGPQGAILSVAGGVVWEDVKALVERLFGSWQGGEAPSLEVQVNKAHTRHITAQTAQTQIGVAYEAVPPGQPEWYKNALSVAVLSKGMGSRLFAEVREKRGLVYNVAAMGRAVRGYGYTLAYAGTTPDRAAETLEVLLGELTRLQDGVSAEELERARTGLLSGLVMEGESSGGVASNLARNTFLFGEPRPLETVKAELSAVTLGDLNRYLAERPEPRFTVLTLGPNALDADPAKDSVEKNSAEKVNV